MREIRVIHSFPGTAEWRGGWNRGGVGCFGVVVFFLLRNSV